MIVLADLVHKLWASSGHMLRCTKDGRNWILMYAGNGWDASYKCFIFDAGVVDGVDIYARLVRFEALVEDVKYRYSIHILEDVSLDDWKAGR